MKKLITFPERIGWRDHVVGLTLATATVVWLLATTHAIGFARDEGFYFRAATQYARWFETLFHNPSRAFDQHFIDSLWGYNHEHPALMKSLFALSWLGPYRAWHWFANQSTAFRFPTMVMSGIAVWVTYLFGARAFTRRAGLIAAALLMFMPRVFYHAHLAAFDMPVVAMWVLCIYVYWRSVDKGGLGWALLAGLVYGLTLETKHNAWIIPAVIVPHALLLVAGRLRRELEQGLLPIPASLVAMAVIGPAVFVGLWPWMWHDPMSRFQEYFNFHMHHVYYNMEFLGKNYFRAPSPRGYMPVMIVATVPTITLLLFFIGAGERLWGGWGELRSWWETWKQSRADDREQEGASKPKVAESQHAKHRSHVALLLGLGVAAAVAPWLLSKTPIFGGTKHWMTAYPLAAIFAGWGADLWLRTIEGQVSSRFGHSVARYSPVAAVLLLAAPAAETVHSHPFGLSSYVPVVGGARGAATIGLNRQFWGYTTQNASEEYLAKHARFASKVFIHDTAWDAWSRMIDEGKVRKDLRGVGAPAQGDYALIHHEKHMIEVAYQVWVAFHTRTPVYIVTHDEVPIVSIYKKH